MKRYEGMFLYDTTALHDWPALEGETRRLLDRINAEVEALVKFDERKLAYPIKGRKRGAYVLTVFQADPTKITQLEHDANLSEPLLRMLVLRNENTTDSVVAELKAHPPDQPWYPTTADGRRGGEDRMDGGRGGRDGGWRDGGGGGWRDGGGGGGWRDGGRDGGRRRESVEAPEIDAVES